MVLPAAGPLIHRHSLAHHYPAETELGCVRGACGHFIGSAVRVLFTNHGVGRTPTGGRLPGQRRGAPKAAISEDAEIGDSCSKPAWPAGAQKGRMGERLVSRAADTRSSRRSRPELRVEIGGAEAL